MLHKVPKAFLLEITIVHIAVFRLVFFYTVTLEETIESVRAGIQPFIEEKEVTCERLASVLIALQDNVESINASNAISSLAHDVHSCTVDVADMRTFALSAHPFNLRSFFSDRSPAARALVLETIRQATTPGTAYRCEKHICTDWASVLSFMPTFGILSGWLSGSLEVVQHSLVISVLTTLALFGFGYAISGALCYIALRPGLRGCPTILVGLGLPFGCTYRSQRCIAVVILYVLAFSVTGDSVDRTILVRIVLRTMALSVKERWFVLVLSMTFVCISGRTESERLAVCRTHESLEGIDRDVSWLWMNGPTENLKRLSPLSLVAIADMSANGNIRKDIKLEIARILSSDPLIVGLSELARVFKETDQSSAAQYARKVRRVSENLIPSNLKKLVKLVVAAVITMLYVL